jgi:SAM-dependent methyltransferase
VIVAGHNRESGTETVERLLADDQPGLFTAIGELHWYASSHRRWINDLSIRAGGSVLEVGSATGALTAFLESSGFGVTGLDNSSDMVSRGQSEHPELDLIVGDATALPHDDDVFDAVVAASVINVVPDATAVLSEMRRVCAPGGIVSVLVPSTGFTGEDLDTLIGTLGLTDFSEAALTKWHQGPPKMNRKQLGDLLGGVGLEHIVTHSYLDGMLVAATATVR